MSASASIAKVNHWHQQLALYLIANPTHTNDQVAKHFDVTAPWLSTVKNSDAFRDYFAQLQSQHAGAVLLSVRDKQLGLADMVISKLADQVHSDAGVSTRELLDIADVMLKHQPQAPAAANVQNVVVVSADVLQKAREELRAPRILSPAGGSALPRSGAEIQDASYVDLPSSLGDGA